MDIVLRFNLHINLSLKTLLTCCIDKILTCKKIGNSFKILKEKGRNNTWKKRAIDDQRLNISAKATFKDNFWEYRYSQYDGSLKQTVREQ